jgi:hypothetical protein
MSPPNPKHPLALALEWVSKITTVGLEMVLPGVAGAWLDRQWGTSWIALAGFSVGLVVGMWHLLRMVNKPGGGRGQQASATDDNSPDSTDKFS